MTPDDVKAVLGDLPDMTLRQAWTLSSFIREHRVHDILELGFRHGVSTCYLAAALEESEGGRVTTIDLETSRDNNPSIETLLERTGLKDRVVVFREPTSYNWRLMKMLESEPRPLFDLCYLDGAHDWFVDGLAFFLVDRLLRPGGWIVFDDLDWTYARSPSMKDLDLVKNMPAEERDTPHVRKIYELLVKTHPCYGDFRDEGHWAYAHKMTSSPLDPPPIRREVVVQRTPTGRHGIRARLRRLFR
jgi:predicted O-methyltransferase YrrM